MNQAMLIKLVWRLISNPQSFLSQFLALKCERGVGWWSSLPRNSSTSFVGRSINKDIQCLKNKVYWVVGNNINVKLGLDPWVPICLDIIPRINPRHQSIFNLQLSFLSYKGLPSGQRNSN